jgi:hypothetical protein
MAGFFLALGALGAIAASRPSSASSSAGLDGVFDLVSNPAVFGLAAGIANGLLATARDKPVSLTANLVTAAVIGISEGILVENRDTAVSVGFLSALGAVAGMSGFTRFNPRERAVFERQSVPLLGGTRR